LDYGWTSGTPIILGAPYKAALINETASQDRVEGIETCGYNYGGKKVIGYLITVS
jgi:hypothetical protein